MGIGNMPDEYSQLKKVVKELLFNGASLELETEQGLTARDLCVDI